MRVALSAPLSEMCREVETEITNRATGGEGKKATKAHHSFGRYVKAEHLGRVDTNFWHLLGNFKGFRRVPPAAIWANRTDCATAVPEKPLKMLNFTDNIVSTRPRPQVAPPIF